MVFAVAEAGGRVAGAETVGGEVDLVVAVGGDGGGYAHGLVGLLGAFGLVFLFLLDWGGVVVLCDVDGVGGRGGDAFQKTGARSVDLVVGVILVLVLVMTTISLSQRQGS